MKMLLIEKKTKLLVSGDKTTRITLETTDPSQIVPLQWLDNASIVEVEIKDGE